MFVQSGTMSLSVIFLYSNFDGLCTSATTTTTSTTTTAITAAAPPTHPNASSDLLSSTRVSLTSHLPAANNSQSTQNKSSCKSNLQRPTQQGRSRRARDERRNKLIERDFLLPSCRLARSAGFILVAQPEQFCLRPTRSYPSMNSGLEKFPGLRFEIKISGIMHGFDPKLNYL